MVDVDDGGDNGHSCGSLVDAVVDWDVDLADSAANIDSEGGKYTSAIASVYLPPSGSTLR